MIIGIIGAGHIGGTLGHLWAEAGHDIVFGTRNPERVDLQPRMRSVSAQDAANFGSVVVFAGPYGAWPGFAEEAAAALAGKVVIDAANPYPERDGAIVDAVDDLGLGSGAYTARLLPDSQVVKGFNTIYWVDLRDQAHRPGERLAMPLAGDDADALETTAALANQAGFEPVIVGGLVESAALDPGSPIYAKSFTAAQVRAALALPSHP